MASKRVLEDVEAGGSVIGQVQDEVHEGGEQEGIEPPLKRARHGEGVVVEGGEEVEMTSATSASTTSSSMLLSAPMDAYGDAAGEGEGDDDDDGACDVVVTDKRLQYKEAVDLREQVVLPEWVKRSHKRKIGVVFGYCGFDFRGLQVNPQVPMETIEGVLEAAVVRARGISPLNAGQFAKSCWARACRTDKGVHAMGNVVTFKVQVDPEDCDKAYGFEKADLDGIVAEIAGPPAGKKKALRQQLHLEYARDAAALLVLRDRVNAELPADIKVFSMFRVTGGFNCKNAVDFRLYEYLLPVRALATAEQWRADQGASFSLTAEELEQFRDLLHVYEGTRNFHNFTTGKKFTDADAKRFINSVSVSDPVVIPSAAGDSVPEPYVRIRLQGASFVLHQIRRMIALAIITFRHRNLVAEKQREEVATIAAAAAAAAASAASVPVTAEVPAADGVAPAAAPTIAQPQTPTQPKHQLDNVLLNALGWKNVGFPMVPGEMLSLDFAAYNSYNRKLKKDGLLSPPINMRADSPQNQNMLKQRNEFRDGTLYPRLVEVSQRDSFLLLQNFFGLVDKWGVKFDDKEAMQAGDFVVFYSEKKQWGVDPTHKTRVKKETDDWA